MHGGLIAHSHEFATPHLTSVMGCNVSHPAVNDGVSDKLPRPRCTRYPTPNSAHPQRPCGNPAEFPAVECGGDGFVVEFVVCAGDQDGHVGEFAGVPRPRSERRTCEVHRAKTPVGAPQTGSAPVASSSSAATIPKPAQRIPRDGCSEKETQCALAGGKSAGREAG